jgi:hypothetical protein
MDERDFQYHFQHRRADLLRERQQDALVKIASQNKRGQHKGSTIYLWQVLTGWLRQQLGKRQRRVVAEHKNPGLSRSFE